MRIGLALLLVAACAPRPSAEPPVTEVSLAPRPKRAVKPVPPPPLPPPMAEVPPDEPLAPEEPPEEPPPPDYASGGVLEGPGDEWSAPGEAVDVATGPRTAKVYQPGRLAVAPAAPTGKTARPKGTNWNCAFPPEADADDIDRAVVVVSVLIAADGKARDVKLVTDPGHGFGRAARHCVLTREYEPARDAGDAAIDSRITLRVVFTR